MASQIDITKPAEGAATTLSVRQNFTYAKSEIETLQGETAAIAGAISAAIQAIYPIGALYISTLADNPNAILGFGTWSAFGAGKVMVALDATQTEFDTLEETGGAKTHTLTVSEMPNHSHTQNAHNHTQVAHNHTQDAHRHTSSYSSVAGAGSGVASSTGTKGTSYFQNVATATNQATTATNQATTATNQTTGGGTEHNNLQPYIVIAAWKRTA